MLRYTKRIFKNYRQEKKSLKSNSELKLTLLNISLKYISILLKTANMEKSKIA